MCVHQLPLVSLLVFMCQMCGCRLCTAEKDTGFQVIVYLLSHMLPFILEKAIVFAALSTAHLYVDGILISFIHFLVHQNPIETVKHTLQQY